MIQSTDLYNNLTVIEIGSSNVWLINDLKKFKKINYVGSDVVKLPIEKLAKRYFKILFLKFDITKKLLKK